MSRFLYVRGLRQVEHTVFGVVDGQKYYWSPINGQRQPYSSGQQVKRSILDAMVDLIPNEQRAPITFNYQVKRKTNGEVDKIDQKEPWNPCDPQHADQLIGGWMRAAEGSKAIRRRSPLSISAMRPLHPSLANLEKPESGTFDRSDNPEHHIVRVRDEKGKELTDEEVAHLLNETDRSLPMRNWLDLGPRATGLFIFDIAVDLDLLFSVSTNQYDAELLPEQIEQLRQKGWIDQGTRLIAPEPRRIEIADALARAVVDWRITSNQSRTFHPQGTLAIAISNNANRIVNAIRADLKEDLPTDRLEANPILDTTIPETNLFIAPIAKGVVPGVVVDNDAIEEAIKQIRSSMEKAIHGQ